MTINIHFLESDRQVYVHVHDHAWRHIYNFTCELHSEGYGNLGESQDQDYNTRARIVARHIAECLMRPENMAKLEELLKR